MLLSLIVAMDERGLIGREGQLPWHLPADLRHFKQATLGKPILMGRKTWASIGRPLPGRRNIVLSRDPAFHAEGAERARSLDEALEHCRAADEVMVIGGAALYAEALPRVGRLYLTRIHHRAEGDTFFPAWQPGEWREIHREDRPADEKNPFPMSFLLLERDPPPPFTFPGDPARVGVHSRSPQPDPTAAPPP